ncbi:DPH3 homolog [Anopheles funestus]|uniref:DPH3 homolog n=1 Tax=Anopheles funestus TaxID=62324 RepID=UPI0020C64F95|nr:DPH3 homolog [Anopheles funestus]
MCITNTLRSETCGVRKKLKINHEIIYQSKNKIFPQSKRKTTRTLGSLVCRSTVSCACDENDDRLPAGEMSVYHDEVEIEDFEYDEEEEMYYYPCPCGDRFQISREALIAGEEVATCPSCSLIVKVIYDPEAFAAEQDEVEQDSGKVVEQPLEKN